MTIRVGIIGLSSVTTNIPAFNKHGWAASAHLPPLLALPNYTLTALCNTSLAAAHAAIKRYSLPPSTKAYDSPSDLASDPDIDMVVCCVRVDRHYETIMPSIRAGKDVFVEWPLGANLREAREMLEAARVSGSKTVVGLQGRVSPYATKVREMVGAGVIGELLSAQVTCYMGIAGDVEPAGMDYLVKKEVGGNFHSIMFGHVADTAIFALGGDVREYSAVLATRWGETTLLHSDGTFKEVVKRETPDHIMFQGVMAGSGAPVSIYVRHGKAFKDEPKFRWRILGTKGEIRVTAHAGLGVSLGGEKIELFDHEKDSIDVVDVEYSDTVKDLHNFAKNIGRVYELFANGGTGDDGLVDFEKAVKFHEIIEGTEKSWEEKRFVKLSE